jgi:hypothetical protein
MKLSALVDFPDDACVEYTPDMVESMISQLSDVGFDRIYVQYYGNREYGWIFNNEAPNYITQNQTSKNMPNYSQVFVDAAKRHGMEAAVVMRPQEQGIWTVYSPYYTKDKNINSGIPHLGGRLLVTSTFLQKHPELRIKRRSWDIDSDAVNKVIGSIKLYKQNNVPSRIKKENITIYTSKDNSYYKPYTKPFDFSVSEELAQETVVISKTVPDYDTELLTLKGMPIQVLTLGNLEIADPFVAIGVRCEGDCDDKRLFRNTPVHAIACFDLQGNKICATPGGTRRPTPLNRPFLEAGFHFDDGFGAYQAITLDPKGSEGFLAIAKRKNRYVHGALCECEPAVREYWLQTLEDAMDDGYDLVGNRIECHSVHVDEPLAYGYNDCIKEEYYRRYGYCKEENMELDKIAKIRGDAYTELFMEAAKRIRAKGKKIFLTLNIEMLHNPIPLDRRYAYPMNVEWQWERWLKEIRPDEINFRMYYNTPKFLLSDPQCLRMLETAKSYDVPLTIERYTYWDFPAEYEFLRDTGLFSRMTLYETANVLAGDGKGRVVPTERGKDILPRLSKLLKQNNNGY